MKKALLIVLTLLLLAGAAAAESTEVTGELTFVKAKDLPDSLMEQKLSDKDLSALDHESLDVLKKRISTFGDFVAWVEMKARTLSFTSWTTSNPSGQFTFGAEFAYQWLSSWYSPNQTACVAQYVLEDNYPGIALLVCGVKSGSSLSMRCALAIPADGGWYLLNPEMFSGLSQNQLESSCAFPYPLFVTDLTGIVKYFDDPRAGERLLQAFTLTSADQFVINPEGGVYVPVNTDNMVSVYENDMARYPDPDEKLPFKTYGFPKQIKTDSSIDLETAVALSKGSVEEAAEAIHTIPDCLNYLFYSGYMVDDGDQQLQVHDGTWHYNFSPRKIFERQKGNCGGTSGLIARLLEGDYDEVGMINMTFQGGEGHVINYVRDGKNYYVFDGVQWVSSGYESYGLSFVHGTDLKKTAAQYGKPRNTRLMVAYTHSAGGDLPIIWDGSAVTYLPNGYCDTLTILQETPKEGYVYTMIDADPAALQAIDMIRDVW